jgi:hypothetical protein
MYNLNEEYSLGQLIPFVLAFAVAYGVAKILALLGLLTSSNMNKWAIFFAAVTGIAYAIQMTNAMQPKHELLRIVGPAAAAMGAGFVSWLIFWFAFATVCKDQNEKSN